MILPMAITGKAPERRFPRHVERSVQVRAAAESIFTLLDSHENISAHMNRPTWAMLGGTMTSSVDELAGKEVGSVIEIEGQVLGISISLAEKIVQRVPPRCKSWETIGTPRLIVMGGYRLGFEIQAAGEGCRVTVSISYELPHSQPEKVLGFLFGPAYARWCVSRIIEAAMKTP